MFAPGVLTSMWGGQVRAWHRSSGSNSTRCVSATRSWVTPEPIDCTMMHVAPGQVAAVRFAVEGMRDGEAVITMEHVNRLTPGTAPDWAYPPDGRARRAPGGGDTAIRASRSTPISGWTAIDHNEGGVISTAARAVNADRRGMPRPERHIGRQGPRPLDHLRRVMR